MTVRVGFFGGCIPQVWTLLWILMWCSVAWCEIGGSVRMHALDSDTTLEDGEVADEIVEEVDAVEVVETVELEEIDEEASRRDEAGMSSTNKPSSLPFAKLAGRLHPAFVHLPLGLLVALLVLEISARKKPCSAGKWIWGIAVVSFFPAVISGFLRARELLALGGQTDVSSHRNWMIVALATLIAAATLKMKPSLRNSQTVQWVCVVLIALAVVFAFLGAHLGGKLVYGSEFLPF